MIIVIEFTVAVSMEAVGEGFPPIGLSFSYIEYPLATLLAIACCCFCLRLLCIFFLLRDGGDTAGGWWEHKENPSMKLSTDRGIGSPLVLSPATPADANQGGEERREKILSAELRSLDPRRSMMPPKPRLLEESIKLDR